jgi:SNF2 family DNA or RNA helicase
LEDEAMLTPRPYQEEDIQKGLKAKHGGVLIGNDLGTGKTLTAVEIVRRGFPDWPRVLVVAPLNTFGGWERHIRSQIPDAPIYIHPPGGRSSKEAKEWWKAMESGRPGWYILGWEVMRGTPTREQSRQFKERVEQAKAAGLKLPPRPIYLHWGAFPGWDVTIFDEVHRVVNRKSTTAKTAKTIPSRFRMGLSGTPAGNKVEGYWSVIDLLWPGYLPSYWRWVSDFCLTERNAYSGRSIIGEKYPGVIAEHCVPTYIRRTTEEVNADLPGVIERKVVVPLLKGAQTKAYRELEKQAFVWLENEPLGTPLGVEHALRLRQIAMGNPRIKETGEVTDLGFPKITLEFPEDTKSAKIDALKEILQDLPEDEPVLILSHSAAFAVPVVHQLNKAGYGPTVAFTGSTSAKGRQNILKYFGKPGGPRIVVAGIQAIGEGTDGLQYVCNHEVWLSRHDNNMLNQQAARRLDRPGQTKPVQRWVIESRHTIDQDVYERTEDNTNRMQRAYG